MRRLMISCLLLPGILAGTERTVEPFLGDLLQSHVAVRDLAIGPDGQELYFSSQSLFGEMSAIICLKRKNEQWGDPEMASFSGDYRDLEPFLSPDGLRLYFASNRPLEIGAPAKDFDIWYVERDSMEGSWSDPVNLGSPVNTEGNEFYPAVTTSGDLYFTSDGEGTKGNDDIFYSPREGDGYAAPVSLGEAINSEGYEFNAWISPDGTYLIYTAYNREGGLGSGDLYVSRKGDDGEWGPSDNLGPEINSDRMDYCPFVDANDVLYFTSKRVAFPLEPFGLDSMDNFLKVTDQAENGQSRLYRVNGVNLMNSGKD